MNWYNALLLFLWATPNVLLAVLVAVLCKRRLYREFPVFFAYALYEIAEFILLFTLYSVLGVSSERYAYVFSATLLLNVAMRFGVIDEVSRDLFRESQFLRVSARRSLQCVTGLLLVLGILFAVYAPGDNSVRWHAGVSVVNRGAAMVQCGSLLFLLLFAHLLGLSWRRTAFGIALGLGILTSVDLATSAIRAEFSGAVAREILNLLLTGAYLVCVLMWTGYLLAPELEPASVTVVPRDEVETWNKEFKQFLKQ